MPDLTDGQRVTVQGSGANQYVLARDRYVYSCSCPAWRNMRLPIVERRCKHLIAYLGDTPLASVATRLRVTPQIVPRSPAGSSERTTGLPTSTYDPPEPIRSARDAALAAAALSHVVLFDKMEEIYGLRLPIEIAYVAGFYLALSEHEKNELAACVTSGLIGIGSWFVVDGVDSQGSASASGLASGGGDQRLRGRAEDDPPEVVPVLAGAEPGERYALLYDEPSELPVGAIRRRPGQTFIHRATLIETLRDRVDAAAWHPTDRNERRFGILNWLEEVVRRHAADASREESSLGFQSMGWARDSFTVPYVPGWSVPDDLAGVREHNERHRLYAEAASSAESHAIVAEWIGRALTELSEGSPGRALFLGRELHMSHALTFRAEASELLIRAYGVLGRGAFVEIVRAQHLDLHPSVPLYEPPPPHAIVSAAAANDAESIARAWEQSPPNESDVEEALKRAASIEVFDAIFDRVDDESRDRASRVALGRRLTQMLKLPPKSNDRAALAVLIGRFVERSTIDARAFERILEARDEDLSKKAAETVYLDSRSQGTTPLHIAARLAIPAVVRILIDRGIDVRVKNHKGRMAFDDAVAASYSAPRESHAILLMLEAAGGAVGKVPTLAFSDDATPTWTIGDLVHHVKFGDGIVERVEGTGVDAKLHIRFGIGLGKGKAKKGEVKVLVGKFVERRAV